MKFWRTSVCATVLFLVVTPVVAQWLPGGATDAQPISHTGTVVIGTSTIPANNAAGNVFLASPFTLFLWPDTSGSLFRGTGSGIDVVAKGGTVHIYNGDTAIDGYSTAAGSAGLTVKGSSTASTNAAANFTDAAGTSILYVRNDGNVGVGTAAPSVKLTVSGVANRTFANSSAVLNLLTTDTAAQNVGGGAFFGGNYTGTIPTTFGFIAGVKENATDGDYGGRLVFGTRTNGTGAQDMTRMVITSVGRVGIGTASPAAALDVAGAIKGNAHLSFMPFTNIGGPFTGYVRLMTPIADHESNMFSLHIYGYTYQGESAAIDIRCSGYAYADPTSGGLINPGCTTVGTTLPVQITTEPNGGTNNVVVRIGTTSTYWYYPHFSVEYDGWQVKDPSGFVWSVQAGVPAGSPALANMNNVVVAPANGGSVTIGQPGGTGTRLTVHGDAVVDGNIGAKYQDVAEWVPIDAPLAPGTVVVLDRRAANHVTASRHAYDTSVAGVVSASPGVILGQAGPDKAQIATTGRVRVKVEGAVEIGDLLVTSDRAGFAMKSQPMSINGRSFHQPGTVLGKALETQAGSEGEILVLLSLQ